jgi:hypothetical protein
MPDDRVTDETLARHQAARDDAKCSCKALGAAVAKAAHADRNTGAREPAAPTGRKPDLANITAVPSDSPAARIRDGAQALAAHRAYLEAQAAGTGEGGAGGPAPGPDLSVTYRGTGGGLSPALQAVDAGRCQLQGNGLGRMGGGKR